MMRYFFSLGDGSWEPDEVGTEFATAADAQREAIRFAGEVLRHDPDRLQHGQLRVDVSDQTRAVLFIINVSLERCGPA